MRFEVYQKWCLIGRAIAMLTLIATGLFLLGSGSGNLVHAAELSDTPKEESGWCHFSGGTVKGRLVAADGGSVDRMKVILSNSSGDYWSCVEDVDSDGTFKFSSVRAGTYDLKVYDWSDRWSDWYSDWHSELDKDPLVTTTVVLGSGETVDMGDIAVDGSSETTQPAIVQIDGTVVDENGALVTDIEACVSLRKVTSVLSTASLQSAESLSDAGSILYWCNYDSEYDYDDWINRTDWNTHDAWDSSYDSCGSHWDNHDSWGDWDNWDHHGGWDNHDSRSNYDNRYSSFDWFTDEYHRTRAYEWFDYDNYPKYTHVRNGEFEFDTREGQYELKLHIRRGSPYFIPAGQQQLVDFSTGGNSAVAIPVQRSSASASGTFFLPDTTDSPARRISGWVHAVNADDGMMVFAKINSQSAEYKLYLNPGQWQINYKLDGRSYLPFNPEVINITAARDDTLTVDFTLHQLDTTVRGTVTDKDGEELRHALVLLWPADRAANTAPWLVTKTDCNGEYRLQLSSDYTYAISAAAKDVDAGVPPTIVRGTPTADEDSTVNIQFLDSTATVAGRVTLPDGSNASYAEIVARSAGGQIVGTTADANGNYELALTNGVWEIKSGKYNHSDEELHRSAPDLLVDLSANATLDIALQPAGEEQPVGNPGSTTLPPPVKTEFVSGNGWSGSLSDGMSVAIPSGAMPTQKPVSLSIESVDDKMPAAIGNQPVDYAYSINAWESNSGQSLENGFRSKVALTLPYSPEAMQRARSSRSRLAPAYYDAQTKRWVTVNTFSHSSANNQIIVETDHFSLWSLVSVPVIEPSTLTLHVHLPVMVR